MADRKEPLIGEGEIDSDEFEHAFDIDDDKINLTEKHGSGVLVYEGKKYATGLTWLTSSEFEEHKSIAQKAKSISADFYCSRYFVEQSGYGSLKQGHRMGMASIAAMAADALVGEWHGVFKADNGWLYVAVHSDNIAPDGDVFFEIEEEVYNHFIEETKKFKWPKTYVPDSWNVKQNDGEIELDKIVEDIASVTLKPTNADALFGGKANKSLAFIVLAGVLGLVLFTAVTPSLLSNIVPQKAQAPVQDIEISDILIVPPKEPVKVDDPIEDLVKRTRFNNPVRYLNQCMESFDSMMISLPGWENMNMRCRGNFVEAIWRKNSGTLESLRNNLNQFPIGVIKTYSQSGAFLASKIINSLREDTPLAMSKRESALIAISEKFGRLGGSLDIRDIAPQTAQNNNRNNRRETSLTEVKALTLNDIPALNVIFKTTLTPLEINKFFNFPGLKFNSLEWQIKQGSWVYDFQVYLFPEDYNQ